MLPKNFVDQYRQKPVNFGWNGLGEVAFYRTYSRPKDNGMEAWPDVCERAINGMYAFQSDWADNTGCNWNTEKAQRSAMEAFDLMFNFKWSPPGRGLWMGGTDFVMNRGQVEALQNCAFISSAWITQEKGDFFRWIMEMLMLGVGVGFDTSGAYRLRILKPDPNTKLFIEIQDSREGWAKSVEALIDSYLNPKGMTTFFYYNKIRPKGSPINGFGGVASGPQPLIDLHNAIRSILDNRLHLDSRTIVDLCNLIGVCVVAGNVRRSAEIALGRSDDKDFIDLKDYQINPYRNSYGWVSNNSIFASIGDDYTSAAERTYNNGEPGYVWMENARAFGRMDGTFDYKDSHAMGVNPCVEQILHHREMCTLVEIYLPRCHNKAEFERAIKYAYLYGKSITLANDRISDSQSRGIMTNNRRIGLSVTGITQFAGTHGMDTLRDWLDHGYYISGYYDRIYSQWLGCTESIRRTSVKPSGTVSLVAGVTPGVHFNVAGRYHIRRMNIPADSPLMDAVHAAGYAIEPSAYSKDTMSVSFPVDAGEGVRSESEVSMWEQLDLVKLVQRHWADNAVSATIKFDRKRDSVADIKRALETYQHSLKGISFLPLEDHGYAQAPYESISAEQYGAMAGKIKSLRIDNVVGAKQADLYCEGDACSIERK